tara:strand:+ start:1296 stop:1565 length:270 start_codon:yes stop_codon:yes gene_type:complete
MVMNDRVKKIIKRLATETDCMFTLTGRYVGDNDVDMCIEFGVECDESELMTMMLQVFNQDKAVKEICRRALLESDYGNPDADDLSNLLN